MTALTSKHLLEQNAANDRSEPGADQRFSRMSCIGFRQVARSDLSGLRERNEEEIRLEEKAPTRLNLFWQKNGWFGLLLVAIALALFGVSAILQSAADREQNAGIETEGTVTDLLALEPGQRLSSADVYETTDYRVYVEFALDSQKYEFVPQGQDYVTSQSVPQEFFEELTVGQTVSLRYSADDPARIWLTTVENAWASDLRFLGYILFFLGLFLAWGPWVVAGNELKRTRR